MKHAAWDYEETYYLIFSVSPEMDEILEDEIIEFDALQTAENDFAIQQMVSTLDKLVDELYDTDEDGEDDEAFPLD